MTNQDSFVRIPGTGYMFLQSMHDDIKTKAEKSAADKGGAINRVSLWDGHLTFDGSIGSVQVRAKASSRSGHWEISLHQFPKGPSDPDAWKKIGEFTMPLLGSHAYTEGSVKIGTRTYTVRMFKTGNDYLRLRLPQVMNAKQVAEAAM